MTFKAGRSGNPKGRPKGAIGKRSQVVKLLEPYSHLLVEKAVKLALDGDVYALRLCIERLIPKASAQFLDFDQSFDLTEKNVSEIKKDVIFASLEGKIALEEAERLIRLIENLDVISHSDEIPTLPDDPMEASRVYQRIMQGSG